MFAQNSWPIWDKGPVVFNHDLNLKQPRNQLLNTPYSVSTLSARRVLRRKEIINSLNANPGIFLTNCWVQKPIVWGRKTIINLDQHVTKGAVNYFRLKCMFWRGHLFMCVRVLLQSQTNKARIRSKQSPSPSRFNVTSDSFLNRLRFCKDACNTWNTLFDLT